MGLKLNFKKGMSGFGLLCGLLLTALPGCAEGIVLDPPQRFNQSEIVLPTPEPSPSPSASTPIQKIQVKAVELAEKAGKYRNLTLPIGLALILMVGFLQLLRWIYELTTSSPSLP